MNMRTKRMLRRGLTALAAALAMMTALAAPAFAYAGDSADSTAETAAQQSSGSQTVVQTEKIGTVTTNGGRLNLRDGASTSYNIIGQLPCDDTVTVIGEENGWYKVIVPEKEGYVYGGYLKVSEGTAVTGDNADTAQYCGNEGLQAGHHAHQRVNGVIINAYQHATSCCQSTAQSKGGGNNAVNVDAHQSCSISIKGYSAHCLAGFSFVYNVGEHCHQNNGAQKNYQLLAVSNQGTHVIHGSTEYCREGTRLRGY